MFGGDKFPPAGKGRVVGICPHRGEGERSNLRDGRSPLRVWRTIGDRRNAAFAVVRSALPTNTTFGHEGAPCELGR